MAYVLLGMFLKVFFAQTFGPTTLDPHTSTNLVSLHKPLCPLQNFSHVNAEREVMDSGLEVSYSYSHSVLYYCIQVIRWVLGSSNIDLKILVFETFWIAKGPLHT